MEGIFEEVRDHFIYNSLRTFIRGQKSLIKKGKKYTVTLHRSPVTILQGKL